MRKNIKGMKFVQKEILKCGSTLASCKKGMGIMMKKRMMVLCVAAMMVFVIVGCGKKENKEEVAVQMPVSSSDELLNKVWDTLSEDQKFPAMGGDFDNLVDNAAGNFSIEDVDNLTFMLYIPAENVPMIDEAASLIHAMNANIFTGAAFHLTDTENAQVLTQALQDNIANTQWICGFPDKMAIYIVNNEYVVSAFGNAEIMDNFKAKLTEIYGKDAVLAAEEDLI